MLPDVENWAVIHTHSRCEKVVAEYLQSNNVKYFLPLYKKRRRYGKHIRESMIPLFPGYLFYDFDGISKSLIYKTHKVARVIEAKDREELKRELENISRAIDSGSIFERADFEIPGRRVRVIAGPLEGVEGEFIRRKNKTKLVIKIHILGMAVEVDIDETLVKAI